MCIEVTLHYLMWIVERSKRRISCTDDSIMVKLSCYPGNSYAVVVLSNACKIMHGCCCTFWMW